MPISISSGHPVAGGDQVPTEFFYAQDGTWRQPRADSLLAGTVLPVANGGTGASVARAYVTNKPNDPAGTTSATLVMMGLGSAWTITPTSTGKTLVIVTGEVTTAVGAVAATVGGRYGTGAAPANAAAVSGTAFGGKADFTTTTAGAGVKAPFAVQEILTLTVGTAYWFDLALATANASDAGSVSNLSISAVEIL